MVTLADLSVFPATPEQTYESRRRTYQQWGQVFGTMEEYIARDVLSDDLEHAANGKLVTWVLAPRDDPTTLDFMCTCVTVQRHALVARPGQSDPEDVTAYGVASVYTPPEKRRHGFAQHMMRILHWHLAPRAALPAAFPAEWGAPPDPSPRRANAQFAHLSSDVGADFYHNTGPDLAPRSGWVPARNLEITSGPEVREGVAPPPGMKVVRLSKEDVKAIYVHDARWMRADLVKLAAAEGRPVFSYTPDKGVGAFLMERAMVVKDGVPVLPTDIWGAALLPEGVDDVRDALAREDRALSFVSWTLDGRSTPKCVIVARLRANQEALPILLEELTRAARREGMERVDIWDLPAELIPVAAGLGWTIGRRERHLSCLKWYGPEGEDGVGWVNDEGFCWC